MCSGGKGDGGCLGSGRERYRRKDSGTSQWVEVLPASMCVRQS